MNYLLAAIITLCPPQVQHFPKNLIFVVDTSGSMDGPRIMAAIEAFSIFAGQATDEMKIKVIAFQNANMWWKKDWTPLPSAKALKEASAWLTTVQTEVDLGWGTNPFPAIRKALKDPEKEKAVILISDGEFGSNPKRLKIFEKECGTTIFGTVVVGVEGQPINMKKLGKLGRGGCFKLTLIDRTPDSASPGADAPSSKTSSTPK